MCVCFLGDFKLYFFHSQRTHVHQHAHKHLNDCLHPSPLFFLTCCLYLCMCDKQTRTKGAPWSHLDSRWSGPRHHTVQVAAGIVCVRSQQFRQLSVRIKLPMLLWRYHLSVFLVDLSLTMLSLLSNNQGNRRHPLPQPPRVFVCLFASGVTRGCGGCNVTDARLHIHITWPLTSQPAFFPSARTGEKAHDYGLRLK